MARFGQGAVWRGMSDTGLTSFKFGEWVKDDHVTLVSNKDYWGGPPGLDQVVFKVVPDPSSRLLELGRVSVFSGWGHSRRRPELGAMLGAGRAYLQSAPQVKAFPAMMIFLAVLAFNFLGDALRDLMDPGIGHAV